MAAPPRLAFPTSGEGRQVLIELSVIGILAAIVAGIVTRSYDIAGGLLVVALLFPPSVLLLRWAWNAEDDPFIRRVIVVGFALKLVGLGLRYGVAFSLYGGLTDANAYHNLGAVLADTLRGGQFTGLNLRGGILGTSSITLITGIIYVFTGATKLGGFVVFAWMGYIGSFLCYRAFKLALPDGDGRRYAALVFLIPSMIFWPSSIGKEAVMMLGIGLSLLGVARLLTHSPRAIPVLIIGLVLTGIVRPHVTLLIMIATVAAYFRADLTEGAPKAPAFARVLVFGLLMVLSVTTLAAVGARFNIDPGDAEQLTGVLDQTASQTDKGGSDFDPTSVRNPLQVVPAAFSVLYRPTLFEARTPQVFAVALEGTLLLLLTVTSIRRAGSVRTAFGRSYARFSLVFVGLFVIAFSNFANFGILARQRVQTLPLLFVLLALPTRKSVRQQPSDEVHLERR